MREPADDTRGILFPARMFRHVEFHRYPAPDGLAGLIDWFWSVEWSFGEGQTHRQDVVSQPGVNISVGNPAPPGEHPPPGPYPLRTVVNGVATARTARVLTGVGFNLAAKTSTGGFGAWVDDVQALTDRVAPASHVLDIDGDALAARVVGTPLEDGVGLMSDVLLEALDRRPPSRIALAREVAEVAARVERDRTIARVDDLAALAGVTARTLQRMFASCAGVSPTWVIRRHRLIDAAERVRDGESVDWSDVAAELGYADQAHLTRDFSATIGTTPAAYARQQR